MQVKWLDVQPHLSESDSINNHPQGYITCDRNRSVESLWEEYSDQQFATDYDNSSFEI